MTVAHTPTRMFRRDRFRRRRACLAQAHAGTAQNVDSDLGTRGSERTTRRFALDRREAVSTAVAGVVSTAAYLRFGHAYLAWGVIGDVLGFVVLALVALRTGRRLRHEAALCLVLIGAVVLLRPAWPLRVGDGVWWLLFFTGLLPCVGVRRQVCE